MAFLSILSCHFLPSCRICFTYTTCPCSVPACAALMVRAAGGGWGCVLSVPLNKAQEGAASDVRCLGHLCGRLQMPPLELRKCMPAHISGGHCREERNTAAQTQPTPIRYIEKLFLNYLQSILVGTASESSSQVHILYSNMDGRRGLSWCGGTKGYG